MGYLEDDNIPCRGICQYIFCGRETRRRRRPFGVAGAGLSARKAGAGAQVPQRSRAAGRRSVTKREGAAQKYRNDWLIVRFI